jgi:hypothetical protein
LQQRVGLHVREGPHPFDLFQTMKLPSAAFHPGRSNSGQRFQNSPEPATALSRRGRDRAHLSMMFAEQGNNEVRLAELSSVQHEGLIPLPYQSGAS